MRFFKPEPSRVEMMGGRVNFCKGVGQLCQGGGSFFASFMLTRGNRCRTLAWMPSGRKPNPDHIDRNLAFAERRRNGETFADIARDVGLCRQRVQFIVKKLGVEPEDPYDLRRISAMCHAGHTVEDIAAELGISHFAAWLRTRKAGVKARKPKPKPKPLWDKIAKRIGFAPGNCWIWRGHINKDGYGLLLTRPTGHSAQAHRLVYEILVGPIPPGLVIDHLCRTPACVNPQHLDPVSIGENVRRGLRPVKKTRATQSA